MAITSSAIIPSNSLEEFRIQFNKLVIDVDGISAASAFGASISFEGATTDDFETTLIVTDPTADRTITLPNVTGTVLTTGNSDVGTTTTSTSDVDYVLVDDGGVLKKITSSNLGVGTPTDITVADESSDTTCFPLFVTAATGDLGPKSGTNLTFNSSTGILTATSLSATTAVVPDASGGADLGTTSLEWGDVYVADDKKIKFGSDQDVSIEYDEDGTDTLLISGGDVTLSDDKKLYFGTGKDAYIEYDEDGTDTWDFSPPTGGMKILDDKKLFFGTGSDISLEYDETTTDSLRIAATEAAALAITLMADQGDDAGDEWKINIADGGVMTFGNDINSAGTYVTHLTITPNSTASSSTMAVAGNVTAEGAALSSTGKSLILGF